MTLREVLEDSGSAEYIANGLASIKLYYHGELIEMSDKYLDYLDCEVEDDFSQSYDYDPVTGEIDFDSMYVEVELVDDVVL